MKYQKDSFIVVPNKEILRGSNSELQSIYFWLCNYANAKGICFPSRKVLAKDAGVNIRTLDSYITRLEELSILKKIVRKNGKENLSNMYQLLLRDVDDVELKTTPPSAKNSTTPSVENSTVTQSNLNSINLTSKAEAELPLWLDKKTWEEWVQYRKEKKQKLTPITIKRQINFLSTVKSNHVKVIEQSILNGWTGLFPLKAKFQDSKQFDQQKVQEARSENHVVDKTKYEYIKSVVGGKTVVFKREIS